MQSIEAEISKLLTKQEGEELVFRMESGELEASGDYIRQFKAKLLKKKYVGITLAFEPSSDFLKKLKNWLSTNYSQDALVDLKVDPKIVGGAQIIANYHFRDYSLGAAVDGLL